MGTSGIIWGLSLWLFAVGTADPKELYKKAENLYKTQQVQQADKAFVETIQALEKIKKQQKKGSIIWHRLSYGQANALLYRSKIAKQKKQFRKSCRLFSQVIKKLSSLPKNWTSWNVPEDAKQRLIKAKTTFPQQCAQVPSLVTIRYAPSSTQIKRFDKGKWLIVKKNPTTQGEVTLKVTKQPTLKLKLEAEGYKETTRTIQVAPWSVQRVTFQLVKKPKVVVRLRPPPVRPKPIAKTPITQQWWFWTIVGVGAVGLVAGGVGIAYAVTPYTEGLQSCPSKQGFSLWGTVNCP